jgi:uncharacterized membrane protein
MLKEPFYGGRRLLSAFMSLVGIAAFLGLMFVGSLHAHHDFKPHEDCSLCLWQASPFSLIHEGIALSYVAVVAFLALFQLGLPIFTRVIRRVLIRGPPSLLT